MGRKNYQTSTSPREFPRQHKELPPFPKSQMLVLALCRICEPIAFMSIFPYIYYMIEDFRITTDEGKIAVYAGMVTSAFTFAEFSTGVIWGKLSDKIGRKPVLLMGLAGTGISVLSFGFAPNLPVALIARAIGGLLNGNIGVLQTTVAELVTVKEHQPRAYTIMPLVWCLGSIIGPMIGGALARPCISYPTMFAKGTIWEKFPYLLPNLFSACAVFCGVIIGILFLEETHTEKRNRRDPGLELGRRLSSWFKSRAVQQIKKDETRWLLETDSLDFEEDELPGYCSSQSSPRLTPTLDNKPEIVDPLRLADEETAFAEKAPGAPVKIFTKTVILHIVSYGILAFHTMTFDQLFPVFLSTEHRAGQGEFKLPFKFADGFGMETKEIGVVLAVQGLYSMFSTSVLFPMIVRRVGALALFRFLAITYFMLYLATPYLVLLPTNLRMLGIYLVVIWKCTFSTLIYPSNAILIANSAPSTMTLGTINGVAASTASLCRAFGPTISGALYALGLSKGYSGLAWWCSGAVTLIGAAISTRISELPGRLDINEAEGNAENEATLVGFEDETHDFPSESAGARYS